MLLVLCLLLILAETRGLVSFEATGEWVPASPGDCEQLMCTPSNLTWSGDYNQTYYNNTTGDLLVSKGVRKVFFSGDSYLRHIFQALLITLRGDFQFGSLAKEFHTQEKCGYREQFQHKECSKVGYGSTDNRLCDNRIEFVADFLRPPWPADGGGPQMECAKEEGSVVLMSHGNHPLNHRMVSVNNPVMYQAYLNTTDRLCELKQANRDKWTGEIAPPHACSHWWVSTHQRVKAYFATEMPENVRYFNEHMRSYFDSQASCGWFNYIDVFNMTQALIKDHPDDAREMSFDSVHWGMEVNMVKAQILLHALALSN
mmetsp:Transcript_5209/g.11377  ORF Transcript_5209/g.11377 Transcript_5209/m.11377 type:complete len:314 (-) Transcript_5209:254-1195(-)